MNFHHGSKITFLPFRTDRVYNAARALRDMELHFPTPPEHRKTTPLFTDDDGDAILGSKIRTVMYHMFRHDHMRPVLPLGTAGRYSFHSLRRFYATALCKADVNRERICSMLRWADAGSVDSYDLPDFKDHTDFVDVAYANTPESLTAAALAKLAELRLDDDDLMVAWCQQCSVDLTADDIDWPA